jgi:hypothetical protein
MKNSCAAKASTLICSACRRKATVERVGLLALTALVLSIISLKREIVSGKPLDGFLPVALIIAALCASIALLAAYIHFLQVSSILLRWDAAAFSSAN